MSDLAAWLLEQIAWTERQARMLDEDANASGQGPLVRVVLAECEAKRRIVEWHKSWPVLVETEPEFTHEGFALQLSKRIAWLTQQEYAQRFGTEPPTAPVLRMLASVYADRLGYDESWRRP